MKIAATVAALLLAASSIASDAVTGKWKASIDGPGGTMEIVFNLKADGATLTGTVVGPMGEQPVANGKVDGDAVSFDVDAGMGSISHKGKVNGDTLKLTVEGGPIPAPMEMIATRVPAEKK
jgi:hypothetical protein